MRITVWKEGVPEKKCPHVQAVYSDGSGRVLPRCLERQTDVAPVHCSELANPGQGLGGNVPDDTDVMTWRGLMAPRRTTDENAVRFVGGHCRARGVSRAK